MQVAIAREYFPAYARLPRKAQRKADEFLRKFTSDPRQASIHYEPIRGAHDQKLRSVRIGDDYRAVIRAPEQGEVFLLLWVDHHDEAYRWAASKQTEVHPATGTLQLFDAAAAARALTSVDAGPAPARGRAPEVEGRRLFAAFKDDELFQGGVPRALIPAVRAVAGEDDLDQLLPHLPAEAAEVLTGLAAGLSLDAVLEELLGRQAPSAKIPAPAVDPEDVGAALERPSTQQQFRVVDGDFDLDAALANPLDVWRVYLHPKQRTIVRARTLGPMRVTGGAGTGKTVVALHRAAFLVREVFTKPDDRVLFTTFTVNLAHDVRRQIEKLLEPGELARVEVKNLDAWASDYLRARGEALRFAGEKAQDEAWTRVLDVYAVEGFTPEFCRAEWRDVVQLQDLQSEEDYVRAVRLHRGLPLGRRERRLLWPLFQGYRQELAASGMSEPQEILRRARRRVAAEGGAPRYRAVVVDETQDLSLEALRLVRAIAGAEHPDDLFLVGDAHQRIYGRPVTLGSAGINIRGRRSQELRLNYRTTASICRWSLGALGGEEMDDLDEGTAGRRGYVSLREGQPPSIHRFESAADEVGFVVDEVKRLLATGLPPEGICITARTKSPLENRFHEALLHEGIAADLLEREEPRHPSVRLATMHRIKGLEFPVVFVVGVNEGEVPLETAALASSDPVIAHQTKLAERCLLYVAASRARDALYVSSSSTPSPFLKAMGTPARRPSQVAARALPAVEVPAVVEAPVVIAAHAADEAPVVIEAPAAVEAPAVMEAPVVVEAPAVIEGAAAVAPVAVAEESAAPAAATPEEPRAAEPATAMVERGPLLERLNLPARILTWAGNHEITTLRELAKIAPRELLGERNLGRSTLAETRAVIEKELGQSWESFAAGEEVAGRGGSGPRSMAEASSWDELRLALPDELCAVALDEVDLPTRVRGYAAREGLRTVADLAQRSGATLKSAPNLGRRSVEQIFEAVRDHQGRVEAVRQREALGLLESFKAALQDLDSVPRMVLTLRSGFAGRAETLQSIAEILGVSRERVRQIEGKVLGELGRKKAWLAEARAYGDAALVEGAVPLEALATDPWWAAMAEKPEALDFFGERVLDGAFRVVEVDERPYLSRCAQSTLDEAWVGLRRAASQVALPAKPSVFEALIEPLKSALGEALCRVLSERLRDLLHIEDAAGEARVVGFGSTQAAALLASLRASPVPLRIEDLTARFGRFHLPEEVLLLGPALIGLEAHFPDLEGHRERLVPVVLEVMNREAPERQWLVSELLEELGETQELPGWLSEWHLGVLLRRSPRVRYLGRQRVSLAEANDGQGRLLFHEELVRILREHGSPMPREQLIDELRKKTSVNDLTMNQYMSRPQFLRCGGGLIGLLERDLPGGTEALAEAVEHTLALLEHRQRGLGAAQLWAEIARLSPEHARWSREMGLSIFRGDSRFRLSQAGAVGLSSWESVRVPTRAELLRQCLEEAGGRVSVEAVQRRIEAYYGEATERVGIGLMANRFGAGLRGDWIEREAGEG